MFKYLDRLYEGLIVNQDEEPLDVEVTKEGRVRVKVSDLLRHPNVIRQLEAVKELAESINGHVQST